MCENRLGLLKKKNSHKWQMPQTTQLAEQLRSMSLLCALPCAPQAYKEERKHSQHNLFWTTASGITALCLVIINPWCSVPCPALYNASNSEGSNPKWSWTEYMVAVIMYYPAYYTAYGILHNRQSLLFILVGAFARFATHPGDDIKHSSHPPSRRFCSIAEYKTAR